VPPFSEVAGGSQWSQEVRFNHDRGGKLNAFVDGSAFREEGSQRVPFNTDERSVFALISPLLRGVRSVRRCLTPSDVTTDVDGALPGAGVNNLFAPTNGLHAATLEQRCVRRAEPHGFARRFVILVR